MLDSYSTDGITKKEALPPTNTPLVSRYNEAVEVCSASKSQPSVCGNPAELSKALALNSHARSQSVPSSASKHIDIQTSFIINETPVGMKTEKSFFLFCLHNNQ